MNTNSKQSTDKTHSAAVFRIIGMLFGLVAFIWLPTPEVDAAVPLISPPNCKTPDNLALCDETDAVTVFRWTPSEDPRVDSYHVIFSENPGFNKEFVELPEPSDEKIITPQVALKLQKFRANGNFFFPFTAYYWRVDALDKDGDVIEPGQEPFAFFYEEDGSGFTVITGLVKSDFNQAALVGARVAVSSPGHTVTTDATNSIAETVFNGVYIVIALTTDSNGDQIDLPLQITATKEGFGPKVVNQNELPPKDADGVITVPELEMRADDGDSDGIPDIVENASPCQDANDADTDDDGIADGEEDTNKNGVKDSAETDSCRLDTDNDGIQDGTELGLTLNDIGSDTDTAIFQPDLDPSTETNPLDDDSDKDGLSDGEEDLNHNGRVDGGETDPRSLDAGELRPNPLNAIAFPAILPFLLGD